MSKAQTVNYQKLLVRMAVNAVIGGAYSGVDAALGHEDLKDILTAVKDGSIAGAIIGIFIQFKVVKTFLQGLGLTTLVSGVNQSIQEGNIEQACFRAAMCASLVFTICKQTASITKFSNGNLPSGKNIVYRALNHKDVERISMGKSLQAKNPDGMWNLEEHLIRGSNKSAGINDPYMSTTSDISIAEGFNSSGSKLGIIAIDLNKVPNATYKGYEVFNRNSPAYHYSVWQQETSIYKEIPLDAIVGYKK